MAFVRWRAGCAQLLASVWEDGRPHQILLTNLPGYAAPWPCLPRAFRPWR